MRARVLQLTADEILAVRAAGATRVGIDGVDGAGKTTFADALAEALEPSGRRVIRVEADDFLNPPEVRHRRGRTSPEGFFLDSYDHGALLRRVPEPAGAIVVVDGLFLHRDALRDVWDHSVFLDVAFEVSVARCATRVIDNNDLTAPAIAR